MLYQGNSCVIDQSINHREHRQQTYLSHSRATACMRQHSVLGPSSGTRTTSHTATTQTEAQAVPPEPPGTASADILSPNTPSSTTWCSAYRPKP